MMNDIIGKGTITVHAQKIVSAQMWNRDSFVMLVFIYMIG